MVTHEHDLVSPVQPPGPDQLKMARSSQITIGKGRAMKSSSFGYLIKEGARNIYANRMMSIAPFGTLVKACLLLIGGAVLFSLDEQRRGGDGIPK